VAGLAGHDHVRRGVAGPRRRRAAARPAGPAGGGGRAALTRDQAYRELAAAAVAAQQLHAAEVAKLAAEMDDLKRSIATVEQLLREVG